MTSVGEEDCLKSGSCRRQTAAIRPVATGHKYLKVLTVVVTLAVVWLCPDRAIFAGAEDSVQVTEKYPTLDDLFALYQPYLGNTMAYKPIYFLVATNPKKSKFQLSFRYQFFSKTGPLAASRPWVKGLNFGYTQTSFWDLKSDSIPFEDTSYQPELFHLTRNLASRPAWLSGLFIQSGIQHESNGQADEDSRSTNMIYLRPVMIFYDDGARRGLQIAPKIWLYLNNSGENNDDLPDYRGYFELETKVGKADGLLVSSALRWATEGASVQVDLNYPIHHFFSDNLAVYFQVQYVNALAESLLDYQERTEALRLGLSFIR